VPTRSGPATTTSSSARAGEAAQPLERHAADPPPGGRAGQRRSRPAGPQRDRGRHQPLTPPHLLRAALRSGRDACLRDGADGAHGRGARARDLHEGDGAQARHRRTHGCTSPRRPNGHKWALEPLRRFSRRQFRQQKTPPERGFSETAGQGFEPQLPDPESGVLPLDDPATVGAHCSRGTGKRRRPPEPGDAATAAGYALFVFCETQAPKEP
jgi:hypothetical protein